MIDFPITDLLDDVACGAWLEQYLHPTGLVCPRCRSSDRRLFRQHAFFPTYRCRNCQRSYTNLTGMRAARLFGAAEQLREEINAPHAPVDRQRYLEVVTEVRAGLDAEAFEEAWTDGRRMPLEEVITYPSHHELWHASAS